MIAVYAALKPLYVENEIFVLHRIIANIIYLDFNEIVFSCSVL